MILIFMVLLGFTMESKAQEISVVDVRRNITMSEDDPVYKDFYLSAGPASGLKKNLVVTAVRKINIRDASGANAVGEILVPVGQLKVIAVYDKVAVAREFTLLSRDELPMLEQIGIMSGDRIDIKGAFIDTSKPKKKRQVAQQEIFEAPAPTSSALMVITNPVVSANAANAAADKILSPVANPAAAPPEPRTPAVAAESLEKSAESGDNTQHE